jgi:hypothetical protein
MKQGASRVQKIIRSAEFYAIVLSLGAFAMSAYSVLVVLRQHEDERTAELTHTLYERIQGIYVLKLEHPNLGHIFEMPEDYILTRDRLRLVATDMSEAERITLVESEKSIAVMHYLMFEELYYNLSLATQSNERTRLHVIEEMIGYYTNGLLRNPRVLWLSSPEGGNIASHMNPDSYAYYRQEVLENLESPLTDEPDPYGLFPPEGGT